MDRALVPLLLAITAGCTALRHDDRDVRTGVLFSRAAHGSFQDATFSFEHGLRNDPGDAVTRNDWDLQFGNGGDVFSVSMVTDDRSRLVDLGELAWSDPLLDAVELPEPHVEYVREPPLAVHVGHVYLVRTVDSDTDLAFLVRVESLVPGDRVTFTWRPV